MIAAVTAFFTALAKACESFTTSKERQSETEVIKSKKKKTKAVEYAEKIIFLADKTELKDDRTYKRYRKLFFKYN